jgi:hypothetical protein
MLISTTSSLFIYKAVTYLIDHLHTNQKTFLEASVTNILSGRFGQTSPYEGFVGDRYYSFMPSGILTVLMHITNYITVPLDVQMWLCIASLVSSLGLLYDLETKLKTLTSDVFVIYFWIALLQYPILSEIIAYPDVETIPFLLLLIAFKSMLVHNITLSLLMLVSIIIIFRLECIIILFLFLFIVNRQKAINGAIQKQLQYVTAWPLFLITSNILIDSTIWGKLTWPALELFLFNITTNWQLDLFRSVSVCTDINVILGVFAIYQKPPLYPLVSLVGFQIFIRIVEPQSNSLWMYSFAPINTALAVIGLSEIISIKCSHIMIKVKVLSIIIVGLLIVFNLYKAFLI